MSSAHWPVPPRVLLPQPPDAPEPSPPCPHPGVIERLAGQKSAVGIPSRHGRATGRMRTFPTIVMATAAVLASGCALNDPNRSGLLEPYRVDLPQGNYLTRESVDRVEKGMSPEQVRFVLGTPLLRDLFHPDRWDYVFRYQFPDGTVEQRKVTIRFQDERVVAIEADELPEREDASDPALPGYRPGSAGAGDGTAAGAGSSAADSAGRTRSDDRKKAGDES